MLYKRVMGELAVSRAFGDAEFKNYNYTKTRPTASNSDSGRNDDGTTTALTPQRAMSVVESDTASGPSLSDLVRDLMETPSSTKAKPRTRRRTTTEDVSETSSDLPSGLTISISEPLSTPSALATGVRHRTVGNGILPEASPASVSKVRKGLQIGDRKANSSMFALSPHDPLPSPAKVLSARPPHPRHSIAGSNPQEPTPGMLSRSKASTADGLTILTCSSDDQTASSDLASPSLICERCIVTAEPEITVHLLNEQTDDFILLACDGLYDVFSNEVSACCLMLLTTSLLVRHDCMLTPSFFQACAATVTREYRRARDAQVVAERLTHMAINELNTRDNVSVIFLALRDATLWA